MKTLKEKLTSRKFLAAEDVAGAVEAAQKLPTEATRGQAPMAQAALTASPSIYFLYL